MGALENLVTVDHKYCIPERSMRDNIFLIRDTNDISKYINVYMGIVSLDQEKPFDRVNRSYLFSVMRASSFHHSDTIKRLVRGGSQYHPGFFSGLAGTK